MEYQKIINVLGNVLDAKTMPKFNNKKMYRS